MFRKSAVPGEIGDTIKRKTHEVFHKNSGQTPLYHGEKSNIK